MQQAQALHGQVFPHQLLTCLESTNMHKPVHKPTNLSHVNSRTGTDKSEHFLPRPTRSKFLPLRLHLVLKRSVSSIIQLEDGFVVATFDYYRVDSLPHYAFPRASMFSVNQFRLPSTRSNTHDLHVLSDR